jgi:hypothetical protein
MKIDATHSACEFDTGQVANLPKESAATHNRYLSIYT